MHFCDLCVGMVPMSTALMPQASLGTATITTGAVGMPLMANGISPAIAPMGIVIVLYFFLGVFSLTLNSSEFNKY